MSMGGLDWMIVVIICIGVSLAEGSVPAITVLLGVCPLICRTYILFATQEDGQIKAVQVVLGHLYNVHVSFLQVCSHVRGIANMYSS
jgi:hypothetical protein